MGLAFSFSLACAVSYTWDVLYTLLINSCSHHKVGSLLSQSAFFDVHTSYSTKQLNQFYLSHLNSQGSLTTL